MGTIRALGSLAPHEGPMGPWPIPESSQKSGRLGGGVAFLGTCECVCGDIAVLPYILILDDEDDEDVSKNTAALIIKLLVM